MISTGIVRSRFYAYTAGVLNNKRDFEILKHKGRTPALAVCRKCDLKFFTPKELIDIPEEASVYLMTKYDMHHCPLNPRRVEDDDSLLREALFGGERSERELSNEPELRNWSGDKHHRRKTA